MVHKLSSDLLTKASGDGIILSVAAVAAVAASCAEVAELADALDSKSSVVPYVPVRVRPSAPEISRLPSVLPGSLFRVRTRRSTRGTMRMRPDAETQRYKQNRKDSLRFRSGSLSRL